MAGPLSIRIDDALRSRLERAAKAEGRSVSYVAQKAIESFVTERERKAELIKAAYDASLAEREFVSGEKMTAWVESWDSDHELPEPTPDLTRS